MGKRKGRKKLPLWRRIWPAVLVVVAVAAVAVVAVMLNDTEGQVPIDTVVQLDDDTLLVAGTSGSDVDVHRWSTIAILGADGVMRHRVHEEGTLKVMGLDDDRVWLDLGRKRIVARSLPDLQLQIDLEGAITHHPALSHGYQSEGMAPEGLVIRAVNGKRFVVDGTGTIAPAVDLKPVALGANLAPASGAAGELGYAAARKIVQTLDLDKPFAAGDAHGPVVFDDPPGFAVRSFELVVGGSSQVLHRVGTDGTIAWSTTAEQMLDAVERDNQNISMTWVGRLHGALTVLVALSEFHAVQDSRDYSTHTQWLLTLDPATGEVQHSTEVTPEPT